MSSPRHEAERVFREEIAALTVVLGRLTEPFDRAVGLCLSCGGKLVVTGVGKSGIIAHKMAATLASTGSSAVYLNAGEALHGDMGMVSPDDVVLMLSNSAATPELLRMLPSIRKIGARTIGLFGRSDTALAEGMDVVLDLSIEREACPLNLAPMTSATVALVTGDALASALMKAKGFTPEDFAVYHPGGTLGRRLLYRVEDVMVKDPGLPLVAPDQTLREAIEALAEGRLGAVMVCDESRRLVGIIVEGDVRRHYLKNTPPDSPVRAAMTPGPKVIAPDKLLGEALREMESGERRVYVLPVVDADNRVAGLLRMHDIVAL